MIPYSPVYMADEVAMQNSLVSRQESLAASHSWAPSLFLDMDNPVLQQQPV